MLQVTRKIPPKWDDVDTVLLDMDGTLLDLHFDNTFWREFVPRHYGEKNDLEFEAAKKLLEPGFKAKRGSLEWYCLDYWSDELGLDVPGLTHAYRHLVRFLPNVPEFLCEIRRLGKRMILVTNANRDCMNMKLACTGLDDHFDAIFTSHDFGLPKEDHNFWPRFRVAEPFEPERTLLVDDSLPVLRAAQRFGIEHLVAISAPDSTAPQRRITEFPAVDNIAGLLGD